MLRVMRILISISELEINLGIQTTNEYNSHRFKCVIIIVCLFHMLMLLSSGSLNGSFEPHSELSFDLFLSVFIYDLVMQNHSIAIMHPSLHS